jgi:hypothetical protein
MIRDCLHRVTCRLFGHRWGEWARDPAHANPDGTFDWPMKAHVCKRCGLLEVTDDFPENPMCRCWAAYKKES